MLAFTPDAALAIRQLMASKGADGVRIHAGTRRFARANAPSMHLELVYGPPVEDVVFEAEGARLYVDAETMKVLDDKLIHADVTGEEPRFELFRWREEAPVEAARPAPHAA
jgi:Fe-S cluster assembly iron-binding protein IscA